MEETRTGIVAEENTRAKAYLAAIIEGSDDAIVSKNLEGIISSWNKGAERIFGYRAEEIIGQPIYTIIPPELVDEEKSILSRLRRGERIEHFETVRLRKDGTRVDVSLTISPIRDGTGKIIGASKIARDISERKQLEQQLHEEQERLRVTLASIGDGVIVADVSGRIQFLNPVAEALTGWKQSEACGQALETVFRIFNEKTQAAAENPAIKALKQGQIAGLANHTVLIARDGAKHPLDDSAAPIRREDGTIIGAVMVFRDIGNRRLTEEALAEQARLLDQSKDAIIVRDLEERITFWNRGAEALYGWTQQEALGGVPHELLRSVFPEPIEAIRARFRHDGVWEGEVRQTAKDGRRVSVLARWAVDRDREGNPRGVIQSHTDVTERKRAEEALRASERQLAEDFASIQRLHRIAIRFVTEANFQGTLEEIVEAAIELTHAQKGNLQLYDPQRRSLKITTSRGFSHEWLKFFDEVHQETDSVCAKAMGTGARVIVEDIRASPIFAGSPALAVQLAESVQAVQSTPLISRSGEFLGMLSTHFTAPHQPADRELRWLDLLARQTADLLERNRAENALTKAKEELETHAQNLEATVAERTAHLQATIAELERVSYSLSHDMRAPLRTIQSFSQIVLAEAGNKIGPLETDLLQKTIRAASRLDHLIQDVLMYSRVARESIQLGTLDVENLLRQIIHERPDFQPPKAEVEIRLPLQPVRGHEVYLTQCITNLLDNAVKFVPPGRQPRVRIWNEALDGQLRLWFEDNGIGIPKEAQARVFEMFQRVHGETDYPGTGIGLTVVRKAVERMGGAVGVESEPGEGSRFWLQLPRAE